MTKEEIKKVLGSFVYDYEYYTEKTKEIEKLKEYAQKSFLRVKTLCENSLQNASFDKSIKNILEREADEEKFLLDILVKKQRIENSINLLDQPERMIMYLKYIRFYTFDQIAAKLNYSTKRIYQLHALALEHFSALYCKTAASTDISVE